MWAWERIDMVTACERLCACTDRPCRFCKPQPLPAQTSDWALHIGLRVTALQGSARQGVALNRANESLECL